MERESITFDVVIVGAGPAGLSSACRLMQLAKQQNKPLTVCVVEKGSEVGAHIVSGAIIEPSALAELFPDWQTRQAPLYTSVADEYTYWLLNDNQSMKIPDFFLPQMMSNKGNYIISLGHLCRWLSDQAEALGVEIFSGFSATDLLYDNDQVVGVLIGDMGVHKDGALKKSHMPGMKLLANITLLAEGARGHLGKKVIQRYQLDKNKDPQHYAIGIKEIWSVSNDLHQEGKVLHTLGWPLLENKATGGGFLYHTKDNQVTVGLVTDLSYSNTYLDPFMEFQRYKHHSMISQYLQNGERITYGARAIAKGGIQSLPQMNFPGGFIIGCNAGTLNSAKIKGIHTAMKSGMLVAESIFTSLESDNLTDVFNGCFYNSWLYDELKIQRNFNPAIAKWGTLVGGIFSFFDLKLCKGKLPITLSHGVYDHNQLKQTIDCQPINYFKVDGVLSFDRLSSVFLSNTNHEEDQPCHLKLQDETIPISKNLPMYNEPAQRYCPAGVYEIVVENKTNKKRLQINSQNCIHCKTCDIKDPFQNIQWVPPEGAGGPNYPNM